jgi:uncharacterized membrane protein YfhO
VFHDEDALPRIRTVPSTGKDDVRILRYESTLIEMDAVMAGKGMLVVADAWFPGWTATVDGSPVAILQASGKIRGVVVDGGVHKVVMRYRPKNLYIGAMLTAMGLSLCAALQFVPEKRFR